MYETTIRKVEIEKRELAEQKDTPLCTYPNPILSPPPAREGPSRDFGSTCINIIRSSHGYGSRRIIKGGRIGQKEGAEPVSFISLPRFVGVLSLPKKTKQPVLNFLFGFVPRTFLYRPAQQGV